MALSNFDLEDICRSMDLPLVGVFSKDRLPDKHYIGSYYINMENDEDGNGTHWVFARIFPNKEAIYFDSFGVLMPPYIKDFLKPFKPIPSSHRHIQDNTSTKCGYFDLACDKFFTYNLKKTKSIAENYDDFLNMFSIDKKLNDIIVMEYLGEK